METTRLAALLAAPFAGRLSARFATQFDARFAALLPSTSSYADTGAGSHVGTKQAPLIGDCSQIVDLPERGKFCYNEATRHRSSALGPNALWLRWYAALSAPAAGAKRRSAQVGSCREHLAPERCGLTAHSSERVTHKVPSSCASERVAQRDS
jgi:hypothetical protein